MFEPDFSPEKFLEPEYTPEKFCTNASKQFTDREEFQAAFHRVLKEKGQGHKVLVYYGVGGIGKTSLLTELRRQLKDLDPGKPTALIDFKELIHCAQDDALFILRESLNQSIKGRIPFPTFDLAFAVHKKKLEPHIPIQIRDLPFLEEGELVADIIDMCGDVPVIGLVPKFIKLVTKGQTKYEQWAANIKEDIAIIEKLDQTKLVKLLPYYWAKDLKRYLNRNQHSVGAVIFFDTYEALWEIKKQGTILEQDKWVRELIINLPQILWVISGREKLRWVEDKAEWAKVLEQHLIGSLAKGDAEYYLDSCGIREKDIRYAIIEGSKGVPLYLDISVDTYREIINRQVIPTPEDFAKTPKEVFTRFIQYLSLAELATLKILSIPRSWDYSLFAELVAQFKTGYPFTEYGNLFRFSFISQWDGQLRWNMHDLMRQSLVDNIQQETPIVFKEVNESIFEYFNRQLEAINIKNISENEKLALTEAFYQLELTKEYDKLFTWFSGKAFFLKVVVSGIY
ncbi:ATP-binding protein [Desulfosporosinus sp. OT]|uniref:ATP-binding protein n=1 Tax=Desulfosporosinus sp. OT TaxID=913865 RepID=UPI000223A9F4|nr:ATP-binding protein [Desulfosporosinus sp. OT]EGW41830.1 hypothetical protein DOT_0002 [Desulfosporosinus sp. OT]